MEVLIEDQRCHFGSCVSPFSVLGEKSPHLSGGELHMPIDCLSPRLSYAKSVAIALKIIGCCACGEEVTLEEAIQRVESRVARALGTHSLV